MEKTTIPKMIFIVPYRDRSAEKIHFSVYMKYIMEDYDKNDYEIYYSHQMDERPFNRGATKNIGFLVMKKKYPNDYNNITFIFNDIDTVPIKKNMFNYLTTKGIIKHFYGFTFTLGGIFSILGCDFEKCNGFPNNWGWGIEDNVMNERVLLNEFVINRDEFYPRNSKAVLHLFETSERLISNKEPENYLKKNFNDNLNTIHEINYVIVPNNEHSKENSTSTINQVTDDEIKNNTKISNIQQNEYMINISHFRTFVNPANEIFYTQDMFYNTKLKPNVYENMLRRNRWGLHNNFL